MSSDADAEREEFQRRSDAYQPDVEGPLVKQRESVSTLITEYQAGHELFKTKIAALSRDHSEWRPIRGDGKCGWTASVFAYFETLLSLKNAARLQTEMTRLRAFNAGLEALGYDLSLVDFAIDETFSFMQKLHDTILTGNAQESLLLDAFNTDENISNSFIYHFKLMTSCYVQSHPEIYSDFVDRPLDEWCRNTIEPQTQEIENVSIQALATGVIGPAGFALDVLYLDRSSGDQVTPHRLADQPDPVAVIELLYRPGHYDIVYRNTAPVVVNLQHRLPEYTHTFASNEYLTGIGLDAASIVTPSASLVSGFTSSMAPYPAPSYQGSWQYAPRPDNTSSTASTPPAEVNAVSAKGVLPPPVHLPPAGDDRIRFNPYTFQTDPNGPLTTAVFKNSPFNPNHFRNSSFHPQQYNPEDQGHKPRTRRASSTKLTGAVLRSRPGRQNSIKKHK